GRQRRVWAEDIRPKGPPEIAIAEAAAVGRGIGRRRCLDPGFRDDLTPIPKATIKDELPEARRIAGGEAKRIGGMERRRLKNISTVGGREVLHPDRHRDASMKGFEYVFR